MANPTRATLRRKDGGPVLTVHFNPASLDYTITNTLQGGSQRRSAQYVAQSTGKLSMELVFDTTGSGEDVRIHTEKIAKLMDPGTASSGGSSSRQRRPPPPVAVFGWGAYTFEGIVETYREKIDFFSSEGIPLRATVTLSMSRQDAVFDTSTSAQRDTRGNLPSMGDTVEAPLSPSRSLESATQGAASPDATSAIAQANGFESIRSPDAAVVRLAPSVELSPPVAFAGGGLGGGTEVLGGAAFAAAAGLDVDFSAGVSLSADVRLAGAADALGMAGALLQASMDLGIGGAVGGSASGSATGTTGGGAAGAGGSTGAGSAGGMGGTPASGGTAFTGSVGTLAGGAGASAGGAGSAATARGGSGGSPWMLAQSATPRFLKTVAAISQTVTTAPSGGSVSAGSARDKGITSAGVPATQGAFSALKLPRGYRRHVTLNPEALVRSTEIEGYGTGAGVGFRIGGQATMAGAASVAADVGQNVRLSDRIRFDGGQGEGER